MKKLITPRNIKMAKGYLNSPIGRAVQNEAKSALGRTKYGSKLMRNKQNIKKLYKGARRAGFGRRLGLR